MFVTKNDAPRMLFTTNRQIEIAWLPIILKSLHLAMLNGNKRTFSSKNAYPIVHAASKDNCASNKQVAVSFRTNESAVPKKQPRLQQQR